MKKENTVVAAMQRGFTLVELLVVVAILGVLATVAVTSVTGHIEKADITAAKQSVRSISAAIVTYSTNHKKMPVPDSLKDLVTGDTPALEGGEGALIDPWDNEYQLKKDGKRYYILCLGPDGTEGTEDDIRSDQIKKDKVED